MRRLLVAGALLVCSLTDVSTATTQEPAAETLTDSVQVSAAVHQFLVAFSTLDWDAFRAMWAQHPSVFFPMDSMPQLADGRAAVEAGFHHVFDRAGAARARRPVAGPPPIIKPRDLRITIYGTAALVTFMLGPPNGRVGRRTLLFVKEEGGWKLAHLHGSTAGGR